MEVVQIVEVGPRDGFQAVIPFIDTRRKIAIIEALHSAGLRRMEVTSFASPAAVPQLADAAEILTRARTLEGLDAQVLVPTERHAERALAAGAAHLAFVVSISEPHNLGNVRRSPARSVEEYGRIAAIADGKKLRLNIATAFDCPYLGTIDPAETLALLDKLVGVAPHAEVALCDTTGLAAPRNVHTLFMKAMARFPDVGNWAFHAHDTYGAGETNALAAWYAGVRTFDGSIAGIGGCPFAPGATGNVATEDLVDMFDRMKVPTGIERDRLLEIACDVADLPGAHCGPTALAALAARARATAIPA